MYESKNEVFQINVLKNSKRARLCKYRGCHKQTMLVQFSIVCLTYQESVRGLPFLHDMKSQHAPTAQTEADHHPRKKEVVNITFKHYDNNLE